MNVYLYSWDECTGSMDEKRMTMKLMSARNFIIYDEKEEIVRYNISFIHTKVSIHKLKN